MKGKDNSFQKLILTGGGDLCPADKLSNIPNKVHLRNYMFNEKSQDFFPWLVDAIHKK